VTAPKNPFTLAGWRREVYGLYASVRKAPLDGRAQACDRFRASRDALFREHTDSPIQLDRRSRFPGLNYFPYDQAWRTLGVIDRQVQQEAFEVDLSEDGILKYTRVARIHFTLAMHSVSLSLFWIEGYGGGLFLPFQDRTNGYSTFGGGRYLYDTIKGADLGVRSTEMVLDFNYAYNPSCAYDERWVCPLSPLENHLAIEIQAGEQKPSQIL
jgi:uncharacterized protein (DUF1684 family)